MVGMEAPVTSWHRELRHAHTCFVTGRGFKTSNRPVEQLARADNSGRVAPSNRAKVAAYMDSNCDRSRTWAKGHVGIANDESACAT
jgi:hypothetical protein